MKKLICLLLSWPMLSIGQHVAGQPEADSAAIYMIQAEDQMQQGNQAEALKSYQRAAELQPENDNAFIGWFRISMGSGQGEEGMKVIDQWIGHNPNSTQAWLYKGFLEAHMQRPEEALKAFDRLIELQPEEESNYVGRGQMLYELGRYEEAIAAFDRSASIDPTRKDVVAMKAAALAKSGKYDEALSSLNKLLEESPKDVMCIYNRACIYSLQGDKDHALTDLKKAINLDASVKDHARKDEDFLSLWEDEDFIRLTK